VSDIINTEDDIIEMEDEEIIPDRTDNLIISTDDLGEGPVAVFLYTPSLSELSNHYHIVMDPEQEEKLHAWLTKWLLAVKARKK
jgi:hypothetical protein